MPQSLLAAVSLPGLQTQVQEFPFPEIPEDAGLLKVELSGVLRQRLAALQQLTRSRKAHIILGHEAVGRVDRLGKYAGKRSV